MKRFLSCFRGWLSLTKAVAVTCLMAGLLFVQLAAAQKYELGPLNLICDRSLPPGVRTMLLSADMGSYDFIRLQGGICFEQVAKPGYNVSGKIVAPHLSANVFTVVIGDQTYTPDLPLWQLLPIAEYVDSGKEAVFTVYGERMYPGQGVTCVFHPAFLDNLLGLRLCQADIIFKDMSGSLKEQFDTYYDDGWKKALDMCKLLGVSEQDALKQMAALLTMSGYSNVTAENVKEVWREYSRKLVEGMMQGMANYTSDLPHRDGELVIAPTEQLYIDSNRADKERIAGQISTAFSGAEAWNSYILTDHQRPIAFDEQDGRIVFTGRPYYRFMLLGDSSFDICEQVSRQVDACWPQLMEYNPAVMTAVENTARWAALLRYVEQNWPGEWQRFMTEVRGAQDNAPQVYTPTSYEYSMPGLF